MRETQESVFHWCDATFPRHRGKQGRATALVEEAVELCLAAGMSPEDIRAAVEVPMKKARLRPETESDAGEVADVLICLYSYAEEVGFDAHEELDTKMAKNRTRSAEFYAKKTDQKVALGMKLPANIT